jgi:hypothetical protein
MLPEASIEIAADILIDSLEGIGIASLDAADILRMITALRAMDPRKVIVSIIDPLDLQSDHGPDAGKVARDALALMAGQDEAVRYFVEESKFSCSIVEMIRTERSDWVSELDLLRRVARLAARFEVCLTLAGAGFPGCVPRVDSAFDDVSSFFDAGALRIPVPG